jgi:hypothetical protein
VADDGGDDRYGVRASAERRACDHHPESSKVRRAQLGFPRDLRTRLPTTWPSRSGVIEDQAGRRSTARAGPGRLAGPALTSTEPRWTCLPVRPPVHLRSFTTTSRRLSTFGAAHQHPSFEMNTSSPITWAPATPRPHQAQFVAVAEGRARGR